MKNTKLTDAEIQSVKNHIKFDDLEGNIAQLLLWAKERYMADKISKDELSEEIGKVIDMLNLARELKKRIKDSLDNETISTPTKNCGEEQR